MIFHKNYVKDINCLYEYIRAKSPELVGLEERGKKLISSFPEILKDIFLMLYIQVPSFHRDDRLPPTTLFNKVIVKNLDCSGDYKNLRELTRGNIYSAAMATIGFGEDLLLQISDELKNTVNEMRSCEILIYRFRLKYETFNTIMSYLEHGHDKKLISECQHFLDGFKKIISAKETWLLKLNETLRQLLLGKSGTGIMVETVSDGTKRKIVEVNQALEHWNIKGQRLMKGEFRNYELVREFVSSPKLQRIARRLGRLKAVVENIQRARHGVEDFDLVGIDYGSDFEWITSDELPDLFNPIRKKLFYVKLAEGSLVLYDQENRVKKTRGSMIVCLDNSGSMQGPKEEMGKAVTLALLEIAIMEKRDFIVLMFGGPQDEVQAFEFPRGRCCVEQTMALGKFFICAKGTDFEKPLQKALLYMKKEKYPGGDIVFITDGVCSVGDEFLQEFMAEKKMKGFRTISVIVHYGFISTEGVEAFSDELFFSTDLKGNDIASGLFSLI